MVMIALALKMPRWKAAALRLNPLEFIHSMRLTFRVTRVNSVIVCCSFQLAWEYLLFDNRMKQARTRLVFGLLLRVYRTKTIESLV